MPAVGGLVRIQRGQRRERIARWPQARSWPRTSARPPPRWDGCSPNGCTPANPACWARSPARSRDWWPSRPPPASCSRLPAIAIGAAAGVVCFLMVTAVKKNFGYDDTLDAFGVHGMGGTLGALLTGVFATREVNDVFSGKPMGWIDGNAGQVLNQAAAVGVAWVLAIVGTLAILWICDAVVGLRVQEPDEVEGLDLSMHGEEGYNFES